MHYVGHRASETNPLRSLPLLTPAHRVLGWTPLQAARSLVAQAEAAVVIYRANLVSAHAVLGDANRLRDPQRRHRHQAGAMRTINGARAILLTWNRDLATHRAAVERLENEPELPFAAPARPAFDPDLMPTFPRVLRLANANHPAGTIGNMDRAKSWGWHVTIERPNKAGGTVATFATRAEARDWLDAEMAPLVLQ